MDEDDFPNFDSNKVYEVEQPNELDEVIEVIEVRSSELEESSNDPEVYDYLHY